MRWLTAGVVLGVGLGAFTDGIVLHQIAQWHNMGSAILPPHTIESMSTNMLWDGLFHLVALAITVAGVFMLWRGGTQRSLHVPIYDWVFLGGAGIGLIAVGRLLMLSADPARERLTHHRQYPTNQAR